jgi:hypothetical protein
MGSPTTGHVAKAIPARSPGRMSLSIRESGVRVPPAVMVSLPDSGFFKEVIRSPGG